MKILAGDIMENNVTPSGLNNCSYTVGYNHTTPSGLRISMLCRPQKPQLSGNFE